MSVDHITSRVIKFMHSLKCRYIFCVYICGYSEDWTDNSNNAMQSIRIIILFNFVVTRSYKCIVKKIYNKQHGFIKLNIYSMQTFNIVLWVFVSASKRFTSFTFVSNLKKSSNHKTINKHFIWNKTETCIYCQTSIGSTCWRY